MDERTLTIIDICKGNTKYNKAGLILGPIKYYLADDCGGKVTDYTDEDAISAVIDAAKDYIDACGRPSLFFGDIRSYLGRGLPIDICIIYAFKNVQVKKYNSRDNSFEYVNGFSRKYDIIREEIKCQNSK